METRSNHVLVGGVVLALLAGLLLFIVWLAGLSNTQKQCFDVYFQQGVGGLNKGSSVTFAGVPVGQITKISLLPDRPEFVWVRLEVNDDTPVLQGTSAQIKGVGFTGVSEIQLDGAVSGAKKLSQLGPQGCPVIPATSGGLGALLNSAPELIDRIQRLTERLTELLSDKNQNSIADILENVDKTTRVLAERAPDLADAIGDARIAARNAGIAAQRVGILADFDHQAGQRAGQAGRRGSAQGDCVGPEGRRESGCGGCRRAAGRSESQQEYAAGGQSPDPRPARPVEIAERFFRTSQ